MSVLVFLPRPPFAVAANAFMRCSSELLLLNSLPYQRECSQINLGRFCSLSSLQPLLFLCIFQPEILKRLSIALSVPVMHGYHANVFQINQDWICGICRILNRIQQDIAAIEPDQLSAYVFADAIFESNFNSLI